MHDGRFCHGDGRRMATTFKKEERNFHRHCLRFILHNWIILHISGNRKKQGGISGGGKRVLTSNKIPDVSDDNKIVGKSFPGRNVRVSNT